MLKNSENDYGIVARIVHWLSALVLIGLFISGDYMVGLDYYDPWYHKLPYYHKSIGMLILMLWCFRLIWTLTNPRPKAEPTVSVFEHRLALIVQWLMLVLIVSIIILGYLISTSKGSPVWVFEWFSVPAVGPFFDNQDKLAGMLHKYAAWALIMFAGIHALAALKHHVIDKDNTLRRMLGSKRTSR